LDPGDFLELGQVRSVVDNTWEAQRYSRHRILAVERRCRDSLEFQETRAKDIKKRRDQAILDLADKLGRPPSDLARWAELEFDLDTIMDDIDEIMARIPSELQHARALEAAIEYHQQLERLINGALHRRDKALELLEHYREGLGQRLRKEADEIIDDPAKGVEEAASQIEAPSVVPSESEGAS
jgi:hypothetical protein